MNENMNKMENENPLVEHLQPVQLGDNARTIQGYIFEHYKEKQGEERKRSGKYNLRLLGGCNRKIFFDRKNEKPSNPMDVGAFKKFERGYQVENFIVNILTKRNKDMQRGVKVEDDDFIGIADVVDVDEVTEIKSVGTWYYKRIDKKGFDLRIERPDHIYQGLAYAYYLNKPFLRFAFISPENDIAEFVYRMIFHWRFIIERRLSELKEYWKTQTLPDAVPRLFWKDKEQKFMECDYCYFKETCKSMGGSVWDDSNNG